MHSTIEALRLAFSRLPKGEPSPWHNEAWTAEKLVLPILHMMWDPELVIPQFPVADFKGYGASKPRMIDHALLSSDQSHPLVIIEEKSLTHAGAKLADVDAEALGYCDLTRHQFAVGTRWAFVTNGRVWRFLDSKVDGVKDPNRLVDEFSMESEDDLLRFGRLIDEIRRLGSTELTGLEDHADQLRVERRDRVLLETARNQVAELRTDPSQRMIGALIEELNIRGKMGIPKGWKYARLLWTQMVGADDSRDATDGQNGALLAGDAESDGDVDLDSETYAGKKPRAFVLFGDRVEISKWNQLAVRVGNVLIDKGAILERRGSFRTRSKKAVLSDDHSQMKSYAALTNGWYLDTWLSADDCVRLARWLVREFAVGAVLMLEVDEG